MKEIFSKFEKKITISDEVKEPKLAKVWYSDIQELKSSILQKEQELKKDIERLRGLVGGFEILSKTLENKLKEQRKKIEDIKFCLKGPISICSKCNIRWDGIIDKCEECGAKITEHYIDYEELKSLIEDDK